jgi:hypothetical protein
MAESTTPRAMIRAMLEGEPLSRPLLVPIVFRLAARLENLSLRAFQSSPTKIANALRQIRNTLGLDGVSCYFDPFLEAEALGCQLDWNAEESSCAIRAGAVDQVEAHKALPSAEEAVTRGRIPVACDVLRRLKMMLQGAPALMVGVTAPLALSAQLRQGGCVSGLETTEVDDFAAGVTAKVSTNFLEAGASVVFLDEDCALVEDVPRWAAMLAPIVNIIRFYEALPVLLFRGTPSPDLIAALDASCEGAISPGVVDLVSGAASRSSGGGWVVSLPAACFLPQATGGSVGNALSSLAQDPELDMVTSDGDILAGSDIKQLTSALRTLRSLPKRAA